MSPEEPTDVMPGGSEGPTEAFPGQGETEVLADGGAGQKGIGVLVASIVASLVLVGAYVAAGGLDYGPDGAADPCDARPWTDPQDIEEAAQQFALSAADGAACELGVSREELTRAIADDESRQAFIEEKGISDADFEDALRAGLNRAVDDAENAGAITGLAATGIRATISVVPMSVLVSLIENADQIFQGDLGSLGSLGGVGDAIDAITTDSLQEQIPDDVRQQLEEEAKDRLQQGIDSILGP